MKENSYLELRYRLMEDNKWTLRNDSLYIVYNMICLVFLTIQYILKEYNKEWVITLQSWK